ncbi:PREDICTED: receptor-like cytosolic serine/threonine-protein kinase RBK1 isoform X2 [Brassica oleracea var. oleracea]|uniref:receptor-like cytosolic serine/threonine-protein kinase RBK1 isoform X2 n=1 Tax=Brassica oleracea var. oleracea TaxID=109376 RepID=UPI0006A72D3F|nr:PREDICTED: receptor-like cytosolic serine/threonine-protein kinase RBK1 isoform X2 [Brassica oleracea var. oleracea]
MAVEEGKLATETEKNRESNEHQEIELHRNDLGLEDSSSPRGVLGITAMASDTDNNNSTSYSSCTSCSSDGKSSSTSLSPVSNTPNKNVSSSSNGLHWTKMIESIKKKSFRRFTVIPFLASYQLTRKNLRRKQLILSPSENSFFMAKPSWRNFTYEELAAATEDFNPENMIGKGGHAEVYKGVLPDGETVAIKKVMSHNKKEDERVSDFLSELGIIAHVNHTNAAKLLGFSIDRGLHFVLEYSPHGSLATMLFEECLEWKIRYKVALGIADGLSYLHNDCPRRIIHRDIKASNILLSRDYDAQISDFGLAKWLPENWLHHVVSPIEGTFGYMAPEYFIHGIVDEKIDVFAFGVLLLEIITGRRAVDTANKQSIVAWAKPFLGKNSVEDIVDPRLGNEFDVTEMKRVMLTASMCIHHIATMRPDMTMLVQLLRGEEGPDELQQKPGERAEVSVNACDVQDHTSSSYLNELTRHRQLLME